MIQLRVVAPPNEGPVFDNDEYWQGAIERARPQVATAQQILRDKVRQKLAGRRGIKRLWRSIAIDTPRISRAGVTGGVGSDVEYARRVELGGVHVVPRDVRVQVGPGVWRIVRAGTRVYTRPHPYFAPALREAEPAIDKALDQI